MGMFDKEPNLSNQDWIGEPFRVVEAKYLGTVKSADYGENQKARVTVADADGNTKNFTVYGVLADQISRMEDNDLPATVKIEKDGRANVFTKVDDN